MKVLILAAGYGTRLGDLTKDKPKVLLEVGDIPLIERILIRLDEAAISKIIVNLHYLPNQVTDYLKSRVMYYYEPKLLGHFGTIDALQPWLEGEPFFVINGDTISNIDFTKMLIMQDENKILNAMDEWRSVGTWLYPAKYFDNKEMEVKPYRQDNLVWHDIGTPERLRAARKAFQ